MNLHARFRSLPTVAIVVVVTVCILLHLQFRKWEKAGSVIEGDVHAYYGYLPAYFIFDDIKVVKSDYQYAENGYFFCTVETPEGKRLFKMTMGLAYLYSPFFAVAHFYAQHSDFPANGFSEPYKMMLLMATLFYLVLGLLIIKSLLLRLGFNAIITAISILLLGIGTNLLAYSTYLAPMPHVFSFCLIAALSWLALEMLHKPSVLNHLVMGMLIGLITLTNAMNAVVVVFYMILLGGDFFKKKFLLRFFIFSLPIVMVLWAPQLIYWKATTGNYLYNPTTSETFHFLRPQIMEGLFGFRKGWLVYTPVMLLAIVGLFFINDSLKKWRQAIIAFELVNVVVVLSWWCWWYGKSIGHPAFIDGYALMAIPMAAFINQVSVSTNRIRFPILILSVFFIWLNIFQIFQYDRQSLHPDSMTGNLYIRQFGKLEPIKDFNEYLELAVYPKSHAVAANNQGRFETVTLQSSDGKFFTCTNTDPWFVTATSAKEDATTILRLVALDNGKIAIKSKNDKLFSAELDKGDYVSASRTSIGGWETFSMEILDAHSIAIKASNNKYLSIDPATGKIYANKESITKNERFTINYK